MNKTMSRCARSNGAFCECGSGMATRRQGDEATRQLGREAGCARRAGGLGAPGVGRGRARQRVRVEARGEGAVVGGAVRQALGRRAHLQLGAARAPRTPRAPRASPHAVAARQSTLADAPPETHLSPYRPFSVSPRRRVWKLQRRR